GAGTPALMFLRKGNTITRRHLTSEPDRVDGSGIAVSYFDIRILCIGPLRRVAGIEVGKKSRYRGDGAELARVGEEPHLVALDRPATRAADVPGADHAGRLRQPITDQGLIEVVACGPLAGAAVEDASLVGVAARLWNDVHLRAAVFSLTQGT